MVWGRDCLRRFSSSSPSMPGMRRSVMTTSASVCSARARPEGSDSAMTVRPFLVNGEWRTGEGSFEVHSPYDDAVVAEIGVPGADDAEEAIAAAAQEETT